MSSIIERLTEAQNAHDAERMATFFAEDYRSAQPVHPGRAFDGREQVLANWTSVFEGVPDFQADLVSLAVDGDTEWAELDWHGRYRDGSAFAMRGVIIALVRDDQILSARLYMEPVAHSSEDIDESVQELYRPPGGGSD